MNTSASDSTDGSVRIEGLRPSRGDRLIVVLSDGRVLHVPVASFRRLAEASTEALAQFKIIGGGAGVRWPALDEDISVGGFLRFADLGAAPRWEDFARAVVEVALKNWEPVPNARPTQAPFVTKPIAAPAGIPANAVPSAPFRSVA